MLEPDHIAQGDNLRLPTRPVDAVGALKLIDAFARGTAIIPNGYAIKRGVQVFYRALAGESYIARIVTMQGDNHVMLDVMLPGCTEPVRLSNVFFQEEEK